MKIEKTVLVPDPYEADFVMPDDIEFINGASKEVFPELFEGFLYAAYKDFKKNHAKPKNLVIIIPDGD